MNFKQFVEAKDRKKKYKAKKSSTNAIEAMEDIAAALARVFKKYSLHTRKKAWRKLVSKKGEKEITKLLRTPSRSLSTFRTLYSEEQYEI
jgi:uncharacterized protein YutE (UPF0331/DUF86 family)